jgi:predicted CXXCH cytochrome family protein
MNKKMKVFSLCLGLIGLALMAPEFGTAALCVNCHTMHNMQDGVDLGGPNQTLLTESTCIACHTGPNIGGSTVVPYVYSATATYGIDTLAGGNFRWVELTDDTRGHNVLAANPDTIGFTPPGWDETFNANGQVAPAGAWGTQLTCAGTYGCHGTRVAGDFAAMSGSHHADDTVIDGSTVGKSYRFLYGIIGKEDPEWEYDPDASTHNQYYGYDRTTDTPPVGGSEGAKGISYLCAECHGDFHTGAADDSGADTLNTAASPWLRHPTDYDMNDLAGEYLLYGGGAADSYQPLVPVATDRPAALLAAAPAITNVYATNGDAIVTCISCHRAHGSPYPDLMRWDYTTECSAGTADADCGCFQCHSGKD